MLAVPNAPDPVVSPGAGSTRTETKLYPLPPLVIVTLLTLKVTDILRPKPNWLVEVVATSVMFGGNTLYEPELNCLNVTTGPGVVAVVNTSKVAGVPVPPLRVIMSPG